MIYKLEGRKSLKPSPTTENHGLSEIIRGFKIYSSQRINTIRNTSGIPVWQLSFHNHIIRNDIDLDLIRAYIIRNPAQSSNFNL